MRVRHLVFAALVFLLLATTAAAAAPHSEAARAALSWTTAQQQPDGGFPGLGAGSTTDAVLAYCAAGEKLPTRDGHSPLDYLAAHMEELTANAGGTAKLILAVECAGADPHSFAQTDLPALLQKSYDPASGRYGTDLAGQALSILVLVTMRQPVPEAAVAWLKNNQTPEGGWSWDGGTAAGTADTNSTALALQALAAVNVSTSDKAIASALAYLHVEQNEDGGFPYAKPSEYGSPTDANSTANVVQGLLAVGQDPAGKEWTVNGKNALDVLVSLQLPSGALQWQSAIPDENALATYQAVPALLGKPFPLAGAGGMPVWGWAGLGVLVVAAGALAVVLVKRAR